MTPFASSVQANPGPSAPAISRPMVDAGSSAIGEPGARTVASRRVVVPPPEVCQYLFPLVRRCRVVSPPAFAPGAVDRPPRQTIRAEGDQEQTDGADDQHSREVGPSTSTTTSGRATGRRVGHRSSTSGTGQRERRRRRAERGASQPLEVARREQEQRPTDTQPTHNMRIAPTWLALSVPRRQLALD